MKKILIALMVLGMAAVSQADIIANYTFDGSAATSSDTEANSSAGSFSISSGTWVYGTSTPTLWSSNGGAVPVAERGTWGTAATTFAASLYYYFVVTPTLGYQINISGIDFLGNSTAAGPQSLGWSVNGAQQGSTWTRGGTTQPVNYINNTASGPFTTATTIGIHWWNATSSGNGRVDQVELNGTVTMIVIPEPGVMALLGLGLGALLYVRRNRK